MSRSMTTEAVSIPHVAGWREWEPPRQNTAVYFPPGIAPFGAADGDSGFGIAEADQEEPGGACLRERQGLRSLARPGSQERHDTRFPRGGRDGGRHEVQPDHTRPGRSARASRPLPDRGEGFRRRAMDGGNPAPGRGSDDFRDSGHDTEKSLSMVGGIPAPVAVYQGQPADAASRWRPSSGFAGDRLSLLCFRSGQRASLRDFYGHALGRD